MAQVAGNDATVTVLLPRGADPHDYQPSSREAARIYEADLVVSNGLDLEEGLEDVLEEAVAEGVNVLAAGDHVDPLPFSFSEAMDEGDHEDDGHDDDGDHEDDGHDEEGHDEEGHDEEGHDEEGHEHSLDPHFWLDPIRVQSAAEAIANELAAINPTIDWEGRAAAFAARLDDTDAEVRSILEVVPSSRRLLVTNHDALGYFAARYGFQVVGTVIPGGATLAEPSSAELAALVERIRETGTPAIFAEATEPQALAEAIATEAGADVAVVVLDVGSLGDPDSDSATLIDMLIHNAELIAAALQ